MQRLKVEVHEFKFWRDANLATAVETLQFPVARGAAAARSSRRPRNKQGPLVLHDATLSTALPATTKIFFNPHNVESF